MKVDVRRGEVVRQLARDNYDVNDAWLCDKGRFAHRFPDSPSRITTPLIRDKGLEPASFGEVLSRIGEWTDGARVAILTGGRLMDEDYYALSKLARTVFRTNDLDHRRAGGPELAERVAAGAPMGVTYRDVENAKAILVVGLDAEQEVPILHLRLRKAAQRGARIWVLHPRRTRLHDLATHILCVPGAEGRLLAGGADAGVDEALAALRDAGPEALVIAGERDGAADAAFAAALTVGLRFAYVTRRANDRGALRAGVHPSLLPGGRMLEEADDVERSWGPLMNREPGRDAHAILRACVDHEVDVLFCVGVDPLRDHPDGALARRALQNVPVVVVQSLELGLLEPYATAFLPAAPFIEKQGHVTTWEGRGQRIRPIRGPKGISLPDWEIFASMALACGGDLGFETLDELHAEMGALLAPRSVGVMVGMHSPPEPEGLALFSYPLLIDGGSLSERADELKAALEEQPFVEIHPDDAAEAGIIHGVPVTVRTDADEVTLPARVTEHVAKGAIFVPFNQPGAAANTLLSGRMVTPATLVAAGATIEGATPEPVGSEA